MTGAAWSSDTTGGGCRRDASTGVVSAGVAGTGVSSTGVVSTGVVSTGVVMKPWRILPAACRPVFVATRVVMSAVVLSGAVMGDAKSTGVTSTPVITTRVGSSLVVMTPPGTARVISTPVVSTRVDPLTPLLAATSNGAGKGITVAASTCARRRNISSFSAGLISRKDSIPFMEGSCSISSRSSRGGGVLSRFFEAIQLSQPEAEVLRQSLVVLKGPGPGVIVV